MHKDAIEERLCQIEQDIRVMKTDYREGIDELLSVMRTFQNIIIEERIDSIRDQLAKRYEGLLMDILLSNAEDSLDKQCPGSCVRNKAQGVPRFPPEPPAQHD